MARFEVDGPTVMVRPQLAIAISLILHELSTNAVKYGALSVAGGKVRIHWTVTNQNGAERLDLEWREIDGPAVAAPTRKGFGSRLIERSAAGMGAQTKLVFEQDGLICKLSADLAPITASPAIPMEQVADPAD